MNPTLKTLLERGQGQQIEFMAQPDAEKLAETLIAFANTDGGTILLGVEASGKVNGGALPEDVESVLLMAQGLCVPPIPTDWQQQETRRGTIITVNIARGHELHRHKDGRVLIRVGEQNRTLRGAAEQQLAATKDSVNYEEEPLAGTSITDVDERILAEYISKVEERVQQPLDVSHSELLQNIGAMTRSGELTVTGMLLFGANPKYYLSQSGIVFVRFMGTTPRGPGGLPGYSRREEFNGPAVRVIEDAWRTVWGEMRKEAVVRGLTRHEKPEYPPFAVREAIINAMCHRDYKIKGRRIEIRMFDDRLEVHSPGGLPGYITIDNIVEEHFSRNPRLVQGLFQWAYIEELGLGIDRMIEEMVQMGHRPPQFKATPYMFTVVLYNNRDRAAAQEPELPSVATWAGNLHERQAKALQYLQEHGSITNREYRELHPNISNETARLDLVDMVERGILLKIGAKKGTYYILK